MENEISLIFQRHLLNPLYCGPGRWIISNACSKKHYLLIGKDDFDINNPKFNKVIGEINDFENISASEIFNKFYSRYVIDFPFEDYYNPDWKENDLKTMKAYSLISDAPPKSLKFKNTLKLKFLKTKSSKFEKVLKILNYTFGSQSMSDNSEFGPWFKRTSPSGGGIHPAECFIYIPNNFEKSATGGIYHYYFPTGELKLLKEKDIPTSIDPFNLTSLTIFCVLDIDRVQFRYRTPRSWRPALIDAGHILYSLQVSAKSTGLKLYPYIPYQSPSQKILSTNLPLIFVAEIGQESNQLDVIYKNVTKSVVNDYFTNPFIFLFKSLDKCYAASIFPKESIVAINENQLKLLTHLQYSKRNDRKRNVSDLLETMNYISNADITLLSENYLIVSENEGLDWTSLINKSCHKGWYLSVIENLSSKEKGKLNIQEIPIDKNEAIIQTASGLKRKTCRNFRNVQLEASHFNSIGKELKKLIQENPDWNELDVFYFAMTNEDCTIYKISSEGFFETNKTINRSIIRKLAIGQKWSCEASIGLYIVSDQEKDQSLKIPCLKIGQFAQAIILNVMKYKLESFMTPALKDIELQSIIYEKIKPSRIPYFIAIGYGK